MGKHSKTSPWPRRVLTGSVVSVMSLATINAFAMDQQVSSSSSPTTSSKNPQLTATPDSSIIRRSITPLPTGPIDSDDKGQPLVIPTMDPTLDENCNGDLVTSEWTSKGAKGAAGELGAAAYLMQGGYHVYRCVSSNAPFDLVAYKDDETIRVEVKSVSWNNKNYGPTFVWPTNNEWDMLLVVDTDTLKTFEIKNRVPTAGIDELRKMYGYGPARRHPDDQNESSDPPVTTSTTDPQPPTRRDDDQALADDVPPLPTAPETPPEDPDPPVEPSPEPETPVDSDDPFNLSSYPTEGFNGVQPHVAQIGYFIEDRFGINVGSARSARPRNPTSDHPCGYALDFPIRGAAGDRLAAFFKENEEALKVKYVLWRVRDHFDHVHVSFNDENNNPTRCRR